VGGEVDAGGIDGAAFADGVGGAGLYPEREGVSGFDLDAEEATAVVEDEVVALRSPRAWARNRGAGLVEEGGWSARRHAWYF
jgi:hypothetical protein